MSVTKKYRRKMKKNKQLTNNQDKGKTNKNKHKHANSKIQMLAPICFNNKYVRRNTREK
jgi:hypothetical protein